MMKQGLQRIKVTTTTRAWARSLGFGLSLMTFTVLMACGEQQATTESTDNASTTNAAPAAVAKAVKAAPKINRGKEAATWQVATSVEPARQNRSDWKATQNTEGTISFPVADPKKGDSISLEKEIQVQPNQPYKISLEVFDRYASKKMSGRFEQHVLVDGQQVWKHDISGDTISGWMPVTFNFTPTGTTARLQVECVTMRDPEVGWVWGKAAQAGVGSLKVEPAK